MIITRKIEELMTKFKIATELPKQKEGTAKAFMEMMEKVFSEEDRKTLSVATVQDSILKLAERPH